MKVELLSITPNAEEHIVEVARVSSSRKNKTEDYEKLVKYLIKHGHWSPFEHSYMTLEIETSKAIAIQLLRHRSFTFQEFSQRYQDVNELSEFMFEDVRFRKQSENNRQSSTEEISDIDNRDMYDLVENHLKRTEALYNWLILEGVSRETARMILPLCTKTKLHMTGNIRSWIHFIGIRDDKHAQLEMQLVAKEIKSIFMRQLPVISSVLYNNE
jgi:thymidylate synthase (FAD)